MYERDRVLYKSRIGRVRKDMKLKGGKVGGTQERKTVSIHEAEKKRIY